MPLLNTVVVENKNFVYVVNREVYEFCVAMHPDTFEDEVRFTRAIMNSDIVIRKSDGKVIKARSFDPNGNNR
jgi:hypothetical protein